MNGPNVRYDSIKALISQSSRGTKRLNVSSNNQIDLSLSFPWTLDGDTSLAASETVFATWSAGAQLTAQLAQGRPPCPWLTDSHQPQAGRQELTGLSASAGARCSHGGYDRHTGEMSGSSLRCVNAEIQLGMERSPRGWLTTRLSSLKSKTTAVGEGASWGTLVTGERRDIQESLIPGGGVAQGPGRKRGHRLLVAGDCRS